MLFGAPGGTIEMTWCKIEGRAWDYEVSARGALGGEGGMLKQAGTTLDKASVCYSKCVVYEGKAR